MKDDFEDIGIIDFTNKAGKKKKNEEKDKAKE